MRVKILIKDFISLFRDVATSKAFRWGALFTFIGLLGWCIAGVFRIGAFSLYGVATLPFTDRIAGLFALLAVSSLPVAVLTVLVPYLLKKKDHTESVQSAMDNKVIFDENKGIIYFAGKECLIPLKTNQYFLCRELFNFRDRRIDEIDLLDMIDWRNDGKRSVYDAMRLVNRRVKQALGISGLFKWQNNTLWINDEFN
jgi:hypothetical protein